MRRMRSQRGLQPYRWVHDTIATLGSYKILGQPTNIGDSIRYSWGASGFL